MNDITVDIDKLLPFFPSIPDPTPEEVEKTYAELRKRNPGKELPEISSEQRIKNFIEREGLKPLSDYDSLRKELESKKEGLKPWHLCGIDEEKELFTILWYHRIDLSDFYNFAYVVYTYQGEDRNLNSQQEIQTQISRDYLALHEWVSTLHAPNEIEGGNGKISRGSRLMFNGNKRFVFETKARAYPFNGHALDGFGAKEAIPANEKSEVWSAKLESQEVKTAFIGKMRELLSELQQKHGGEEEHRQRVNTAKGFQGKGVSEAENELLLGLANYTDKYYPQLTNKELFYGHILACCGMFIPSGKKKGSIIRGAYGSDVKAEGMYNVYDEDLYLYPNDFKKVIRERLRRLGYTRKK